jgi:hypothetical protein
MNEPRSRAAGYATLFRITPVSEVEFSLEGDRAYLSKKRDVDAAAERLDAYRGVATASLSTDDILALTRS